ncbi:hypothetical protein ACPPVS_13010 [Cellulomonas sp. McL0617]|uniref:hypothetical protein n=1 Tax=Cellulomonas sp. McL0617 TaxID=3415675 RepID=UPI003CEAFC7A
MPRRPNDTAPIPRVALPAVALARHHPETVVREQVRSGRWERVARGIYLPTTPSPDPSRDREVALARIVGVHDRLDAPHWFSHVSAALLWGLPVWASPTTTHLYRAHGAGIDSDRRVTSHTSVPPAAELAAIGTLPVTTLERTVVDCASGLPPLAGLVIADSALRAGADVGVIDSIVEARSVRRGIARARAVIALADGGAESPGESATRFVVLRDGLPVPTTQIAVPTRLGVFWSDLGWPQWRLLLEYDGRSKYSDAASEQFMREKRRHDAVVEAGWRALRVTKEDLTGSTLTRRILPLLPAEVRVGLLRRRDLMG